jgi:hypothetical protein
MGIDARPAWERIVDAALESVHRGAPQRSRELSWRYALCFEIPSGVGSYLVVFVLAALGAM